MKDGARKSWSFISSAKSNTRSCKGIGRPIPRSALTASRSMGSLTAAETLHKILDLRTSDGTQKRFRQFEERSRLKCTAARGKDFRWAGCDRWLHHRAAARH